ncbi:MAG TPA: PAC2 family protein, partial [Planctomycetaceae bacterium]
QPPMGQYAFCRHLVRFARELGVERVVTFAAMATGMRPEHPCRTFAAATDAETLGELRRLELEVLEEGRISGLNGVLLAAAAEAGFQGACLLGEMPQVFIQLPFPKASLAVLEAFEAMAGIEFDLTELSEQAATTEAHLGDLLKRVEEVAEGAIGGDEESDEFPATEEPAPEPPPEARLDPADERRIESLFEQSAADRSKAFELKRELARLDVFGEYEDRFLDLFKKPG